MIYVVGPMKSRHKALKMTIMIDILNLQKVLPKLAIVPTA